MLAVPTFVAPSKIEGRGLFAKRSIKRSTVVWKWDDSVDVVRTSLPVREQPYAWYQDGTWHVPGDDARYINHSSRPNLRVSKGVGQLIAIRDIDPGEELTENYAYDERFDRYAHSLRS